MYLDCRYGDEQHLEEALDKIFRFNKANGIPRKFSPVLVGKRVLMVFLMCTLYTPSILDLI
jgi:hypothetical protein